MRKTTKHMVMATTATAGLVVVVSACIGNAPLRPDDAGFADGSAPDPAPTNPQPAPPPVIDAGGPDVLAEGGGADAATVPTCFLKEDFAYDGGVALHGNGASSTEHCQWAGSWESLDGNWTVDPIDAIPGVTGIYAGWGYGVTNRRAINVPAGTKTVYASVRFADLCRLNSPTEQLFDGAGDCCSYGKTLNLSLCAAGDAGPETCVTATIMTVIDSVTVPGVYQLRHGGIIKEFGAVPRPWKDSFPAGRYVTIGVSASRLAVWLDHTLDDGEPAGDPDAEIPAPDLSGFLPEDYKLLVLRKGAGWGETGGVAAELRALTK